MHVVGQRGSVPHRLRSLQSRQVVFLALSAIVAFQIAQGLAYQRRITPYKASYWLVTYEYGFSRRGLAGEVLRWVAGTAPSIVTIELVQYALTATLVALLWVLVRAAWRRNEPSLDLAAIALCCSPFVFDFVVFQRRPDQFGYIAVILTGYMLWKLPERRTPVALVGGVLLGVAVAISDSAFLGCVGWAVLIMLLAPGENLRHLRTWVRVALLSLPAGAVAIASATAGRLDAAHVQSLAATANRYGWSDVVVFPYLSDNLRDSVNRVGDMPRTMMLGSMIVGVVLLALQGWLMTGLNRPALRRSAPRAAGTTMAVAACIIGLVGLLALGIDWFRWISGFGLMGSVAVTFGLLMRAPEPRTSMADAPSIGVTTVALYLAAVAAFPNMISMSEGLLQLLLAYNSAKP